MGNDAAGSLGDSQGSSAAVAPQDPPSSPSPLEISPDERVCTICLEDIRTGDKVRPMPKCSHMFHASCLERWARIKREAAQCPTCRRPALARKQGKGGTKISELPAAEECETSTAPPRPSGGTPALQTRPSRPAAPPTTGLTRAATRASAAATLRASLGVADPMAMAALDLSRGSPQVAANLLLEHRTLLLTPEFATGNGRVLPIGVAEAIAEANPHLAGLEEQLRRQLWPLYEPTGTLRHEPWAQLAPNRRMEVFRVLLQDVVRRTGDPPS